MVTEVLERLVRQKSQGKETARHQGHSARSETQVGRDRNAEG